MLRTYQTDALRAVYEQLRQHQSVMLQLPTGAGKTHVAIEIIKHGLRHGRRINFCVDRITLLDQTIDKFVEAGIHLGVVQSQHPLANAGAPVQVISLQTLKRRESSQWPPADLFIIDEAHDQHQITYDVMDKWDNVKFIGLSATPFTTGLGLRWNALVVGTTTRELMEEGHLSPYVAYGPTKPDLKGVKVTAGEWVSSGLEERMNVLTGGIVEHFIKLAAGKKALAFTTTVAHAENLAQEFRNAGVPADFVCGRDTDERRQSVISAYRRGEIRVLCNCEVLTKGYDVPDIECLIIAKPTKSLSLHIQMLGRGLRIHPGKDHCLIIDHAGNIERHGFPDDDLPDELDTAFKGVSSTDARPPETPLPWNCPMCHALVARGAGHCPACGFQPRAKSAVEIRDAKLAELKRRGEPANPFNMHLLGIPEKSRKAYKQQIYSQLVGIQRHKNYKPGWISQKYRAVFGVWPVGLQRSAAPASPELSAWVKDQNRRRGAYEAIKAKHDKRRHG